MTTQEKSWGKLWGNLNWREVKPEEIDARLDQGACVNMVEKNIYPLGYDHTNPLIESMKADNPAAFTHLIKRKADLNFHLPFLFGPQVRQGSRSIISDAPTLAYIQYAAHKGLEILPQDFQDVVYRQDEDKAMEKLAFLADHFEKKGNSDENFQILGYLPQIKDEEFAFQHFPLLLKNVDLKGDSQKTAELLLSIAENRRVNRSFKKKMLEMVANKLNPPVKRSMSRSRMSMLTRGRVERS